MLYFPILKNSSSRTAQEIGKRYIFEWYSCLKNQDSLRFLQDYPKFLYFCENLEDLSSDDLLGIKLTNIFEILELSVVKSMNFWKSFPVENQNQLIKTLGNKNKHEFSDNHNFGFPEPRWKDIQTWLQLLEF